MPYTECVIKIERDISSEFVGEYIFECRRKQCGYFGECMILSEIHVTNPRHRSSCGAALGKRCCPSVPLSPTQ